MASPILDNKVIEKLGKDPYDAILNEVRPANIDAQQMTDIVGGNHVRRGAVGDTRGMRYILSDWYTQEMHMMKRENALKNLVRVFEDDNADLKPLASQIKKLARKYKGYQQKSKVKDVTPETPVEVKIVTPEAKSTKTSCRADPCTNRTSFPNAQRSQPQSRVQPSSVQPKPTVRQQFTAFILCCFCFLPQIVGIIIVFVCSLIFISWVCDRFKDWL